MKSVDLRKNIGKVMKKMAISVAKMEANATCPYLSYQPQKPSSVKKLRKF